jgi:hypothetical protein
MLNAQEAQAMAEAFESLLRWTYRDTAERIKADGFPLPHENFGEVFLRDLQRMRRGLRILREHGRDV